MDRKRLEEYMRALSEGNAGAIEGIYMLTSRGVYLFSFSILKNSQKALDVMQDTFIRLMTNIDKYTLSTNPLAWLYTIARNLCFSELEKSKRFVSLSDETDPNSSPPRYEKEYDSSYDEGRNEDKVGRRVTAESEGGHKAGSVGAGRGFSISSKGLTGSEQMWAEEIDLNHALLRLDDVEREVVTLYSISGFKHREIAAIMNKPLGTVLWLYNKSLKKLRKILEGKL